MLRLFRNRKAQAATELAIIGSLIIMVFSYLIIFSVKLKKKQLYIQEAFRAALDAAKSAGTATAEIDVYKRIPNILDPYTPGEKANFGGGAAILWSKSAQGSDAEVGYSSGSPTDTGSYVKTIIRRESQGDGLTHTTVRVSGDVPISGEVFSSD